jgi:membrane-bound lytic murein transglycosylase A
MPRRPLADAAVRLAGILGGGLLALALGACTSAPPAQGPAAGTVGAPPAGAPIAGDPAAAAPAPPSPSDPRWHPASRWRPAAWEDLPGWDEDRVLQALPALQAGCARPAPGWAEVCARLLLDPPADEAALRALLTTHLQPWRIESPEGDADGLITGYYEPLIEARRRPDARFKVPLHALPDGLAADRPWWTRREIDRLPAARAALQGREIAYVADPLDALVLQIQGSGRLRIVEPDGRVQTVRLAYAGHNGHPYRSVGRWLIERGALTPASASWPAIKAWARANPQRVDEMLWANPRVVFFREEPLPDPALGPRGAMGVPLTPGRSIAVDPRSLPYGSWVWLDTTEPLSRTPLRRLATAQDTGSAIVGAVRADYFWGWDDTAETQAGRMKQPLRMWVLWPRERID